MRLLIVRHGETSHNAEGIIQGHLDSRLSSKGLLQSEALAERLATEAVDCAYCSDLGRARETMREILRLVPVPCEYTAVLRERNFGVLEGKPVACFLEALKNANESFSAACPEGAESIEGLRARADAFIEMLAAKHGRHSVLICTHGWNARSLIAGVMKLPFDDICRLQFANASLSILDLDEKLLVTHSILNDTTHLSEVCRTLPAARRPG